MTQTLTTEAMQEIYEAAVHSEASGSQEAEFELLCKLEDIGGTSATIRKLINIARAANREAQPVVCDIERIKRHALPAGECPKQSQVVLLSSLLRLFTAPPAPAVQSVVDWRLDESTGAKILMYKDCSVIEDQQAEYVLSLIRAAAPEGGN